MRAGVPRQQRQRGASARGLREGRRSADAILYYTFTILYQTILYYTIRYCTILYCTILYYTVLYCTILYYTIL